jgi:hypothetical protein
MSFVKCSVDGCNQKLQPTLKVDPRDRDTWVYRECDMCLKPACEKHSAEVEGRIVCDRCRREAEAQQQSAGLIDLGFRLPREPEKSANRRRSMARHQSWEESPRSLHVLQIVVAEALDQPVLLFACANDEKHKHHAARNEEKPVRCHERVR